MPEPVTKYRIFIASPSDVADERSSIDEVISELNQSFGATNRIVLELLKWETHSAPGISKEGSQSVIEMDIGSQYDLFIGILWTKFGTSTDTSSSGTEAEFNLAYKRFIDAPESIQILFYFKTSSPNSLSDINPIQLGEVQEFKESLGEKGTFYWEYTTIEELQKFLRLHIPKRIKQLSATLKQNGNGSQSAPKPDTATDEELGLVDYQDKIIESFANATKGVEGIKDSIVWIGEEISKKTEEAKRFSPKGNTSTKVLRDYFRRTAKVLDDFANRIEPDIGIFISNFEEGADAISKLINISRSDFEVIDQDDFDSFSDSLVEMDKGINIGLEGVVGLLEAVEGLPRMEKKMNKARRNVESKLSLLISKMEISLTLSDELKKELE